MSGVPAADQPQGLAETLGSSAVVRLFGREFAGLTLPAGGDGFPPRPAGAGDPILARIYAFSYLGTYYKMVAPVVFLVYGPGIDVSPGLPGPHLGVSGFELKEVSFAPGVKMWAGHDVDIGVRIDITTGWLSDILIAAEAGGDGGMAEGGDPAARSSMAGRSSMAARSSMVARSSMAARSSMIGRSGS